MIVSTNYTSTKLRSLLRKSGFLIFPGCIEHEDMVPEVLNKLFGETTIENKAYEVVTPGESLPVHYHT
ncbi:MAG: hypothetical protein DRQ88_12450, partial [Epsilonproteobacteria bacterium]